MMSIYKTFFPKDDYKNNVLGLKKTDCYFIDPVKKLFEAVDNIEEVIPEITDIDDEEYDILVEYVREKWDYDEENLEWVVDTAIEAGRSILTLVTMSDKKA